MSRDARQSSIAASSMSPAAMTSPISTAACSPRPTPPVSTPGPCMLAPKLPTQPATPSAEVDPSKMTAIVTSKEWVIPPRPKPGRKPATDTPPTKRKAQNRAAQRAFRERRAARVNELEDKIKEIEALHASQSLESQQEINRLREENAELLKENAICRVEMDTLRAEVVGLQEKARGYKEEVEKLQNKLIAREKEAVAAVEIIQQVASPPSECEGPGEKTLTPPLTSTEAQPIPRVKAASLPAPVAPMPLRRSLRNRTGCGGAAATSTPAKGMIGITRAGGCMKDASGFCPCMASSPSIPGNKNASETPDSAPEVLIHQLPKRPTSPPTRSSSPTLSSQYQKRTRLNPTLPPSSSVDELETDFTALYALGAAATSQVSTPSSSGSTSTHMMADPCGFCSDGTPCVCAEMAMMDEEDHEMGMGMGGGWEDNSNPRSHYYDEDEVNPKLPPLLMYEIDESLRIASGASGSGLGSRIKVLHPPNSTKAITPPTTTIPPASVSSVSAGCGATSGPGSCNMCQKDPLAMLFCQSVASRRGEAFKSPATRDGSCCGGTGPGGGCCRDPPPIKSECENDSAAPLLQNQSTSESSSSKGGTGNRLPPSNAIYIPCSAAYQTLARHKNFDKASMDDFPGLVRPLVVEGGDGKCPRVEVGSLRDVLKMLDRRFGKDVA